MEGWGRRFPQSGNRLPRANSAPKLSIEGANLRRGAPSEGLHLRLLAIPPDRRTRRRAGRDGLRFSIGRRSLGSAPIENPRPSSDSGRTPPSLGWVVRPQQRASAERRAELGGAARGHDNWPKWPIIADNWAAAGGKPPAAAAESQDGSHCAASCSNFSNDRRGARKRKRCQPTTKRGVIEAEEVGKRHGNETMAGLEKRRAVPTR